MKKIILTILIIILSFTFVFALNRQEAEDYVSKFCYIKYLRCEESDIELYTTKIGKVLDVIYDNGYKIILLDYLADIYFIRIDKIRYIKILRGK